MKMLLCSIYDQAAKAYNDPFPQRAKGEAVRTLIGLASDQSTTISKNPKDFFMMLLGEWEPDTGKITMFDVPENLGSALEWKEAEERPVKVVRNG